MLHNEPLSDLVKLLWVVNDDLNSHLHLALLQAEVQARNLGVDHSLHHAFGPKNRLFNMANTYRTISIHYTKQFQQALQKRTETNVPLLQADILLSGKKRGATVYKVLRLYPFQSQCALSHAYHCVRHQPRHSSKFKWECIQLHLTYKNLRCRNSRFRNQNTLWANCAVQCISIDQEALFLAAAMCFQHIDRVDGILGHTLAVHKLHSQGSIHHHVRKEICITEGSGSRQIKAEDKCSIHM